MPEFDFGIKRPDDFEPIPDDVLEKTLLWQFERIVEKHSDRIAIKSVNINLTYRELNNAINALAYQVIEEMGGDPSPVAFLFENEVLSIIAFMAVMKSGRPYLGLHPGNSHEQIKAYLEDSTASLVITSSQFKETLKNIIGDQNTVKISYLDEIQKDINLPNPERDVKALDPLGIFYTSGSTGKPKGVVLSNLYRSHSAYYMGNYWYFSPSDRISLVTSVCFGAAYPSVMGAFLSGGMLCVFDLKSSSATQTLDWIINEELTIFRCTPSIFRTVFGLAPEGMIFSKLRFITLGGEPVTGSDIELFKAHTAEECVLINNFSSTEAGSICHYPVHHNLPSFSGFLPAGFPAPGKDVFIIDDNGQIVQDDREGEIVVRSRYLNLGYWRQPELTAQKFHNDPENPEMRIYYTGDRGHWIKKGLLETLGRKDTQVKVRGYRIQLEAIDMALRGLDGITDAATIAHHSPNRGDRLVAYYSTSEQSDFSPNQIRNMLLKQLPEYMVPSVFIQMAALPRTATGKLARLQLPEPSNQRPELGTPYQAPVSKVEIGIAAIWQKILELDSVGIHDNFFDLGGDSLSAMDMTLEVEKLLSKPIPALFFKKPTISYLTTLIDNDPLAESNQDHGYFRSKNKKKQSSIPKIKDLANRRFSLDIVDRLADLMIARRIVSMPYIKAKEWAVNWSQNSFARNFVYKRRYELLSRLSVSLNNELGMTPEAFQRSIVTNLSFGMSIYVDNEAMDKENSKANNAKYNYWRSLSELIETTPKEDLPNYFPVNGLEHLLNAQREGKGVILLTAHSITSPIRFNSLTKQLGIEISTISYRTPIRQSEYRDNPKGLPRSVGSTMNAEIAIRGQKLLQQGQVINIVGDTSDPYGQSRHISIGGRAYQIKSGFAELALNTGAAIIPHYGGCLSDGRPELNFLPPFVPINGTRNAQIENLIAQYTAFINDIWKKYPEVLHWRRIRTHFSRPQIQE